MQFQQLLEGMEVLAVVGDPTVDIADLTHDSRRVRPGSCFACVRGAVTDGHLHAPEAVDRGAVALIAERPLGLGVTEARVNDVRRVLGPAAARLRGHPSRALRCLGVTGTNGKTTTTYLLAAIASSAGDRVGLVGTTGVRIDGRIEPPIRTTPEATDLQALLAEMRDSGVGTVAMEVSSHALAQHRVDDMWFAATCFTNLSHDHLDYHGTLEAYFEAKASLFSPDRTAEAVLNADDVFGARLAQRCRAMGISTTTYGLDAADADVRAVDVETDRDGSRFTVTRSDGEPFGVETSLWGRINVVNALAAVATSLAVGFEPAAVQAGLASMTVIPGRFERIDMGQPFTVLVDYAHTPEALTAALGVARMLAEPQRVIAVFGCSGDRDREKRPVMGSIAAHGADVMVVTADDTRSEDPAAIAAAIVGGTSSGGAEVRIELDRRRAINEACALARAGDVVLIMGRGDEARQLKVPAPVPFDDRAVAREELESLAWS